MRHAIHTLQNASILYDKNITKDKLEAITMTFPQSNLDSLWGSLRSKRFALLQQRVQEILCSGYSVSIVISSLYDHVIQSAGIFLCYATNV